MSGAAGACWGYAAGIRCWGISWPISMGVEGHPASILGLGLLDVRTDLTPDKTLVEVTGVAVADGIPFRGYEMHIGRTFGPDCERPLLQFADGRVDGAVSGDGRVRGTYVHGLFADDRQRGALLAWIGAAPGGLPMRLISTGCSTCAGRSSGPGYRSGCLAQNSAVRTSRTSHCAAQAALKSRRALAMSAAVASRRPSPMKASSTWMSP